MHRDKHKVSIYIPCFNAEKYIKPCLEGVFSQNYPIDEVFIIDDASTDNTVGMASGFPVKIIRQSENRGLACARNVAIKNAKFDYIASLDADCVPEKNWLNNLMRHFDAKVVGVGGRLLEEHDNGPIGLWRSIHMKQGWGEKKSSSISFLFGSNCIFKKGVLKDVGGYNEKYFKNNYEDVDISTRIKNKGHVLIYEPRAEARHIKEDDISTLFDTFWNWNFHFHHKKGYYKSNKRLLLKIKENIGLANRFLKEDYNKKRRQLMYLDFLLPISLSLKDFLFFHKRSNFFDIEGENNFLGHFLGLIDLSLFYHLGANKKSLTSLINRTYSFPQNFLAFLLLNGFLLKDRFKKGIFLKEVLGYLLGEFMKERNDFMLQKLLLMIEGHGNWGDFLKKDHPGLEKKFLNIFIKNFLDWLNNLDYHLKGIFSLIEDSQKRVLKHRR